MATMFERFGLKRRALPDTSSVQIEVKLPTFFIIGANKAGTTSLYHYCRQHPEIFMSKNKEPMFFLTSGPPLIKKEEAAVGKPYLYFTLQEYMDLFASTNKPMRGEASTAYLAKPDATLWIKKIIPNAKLIAILRNPIERAKSDYLYHHNGNIDKRTFGRAIDDAFRQITDKKPDNGNPLMGPRYLNLGLYGSQLSVVKKYFPDDQLFIEDYEELNKDSVEFMQRIYKFLGVKEYIPSDTRRLNISSGHAALDINKALENKMKQYFEEDIGLLQSLVNFDVMKWLK
jgi:hypothetical protein